MKNLWKSFSEAEPSFEKFQLRTTILMVLFFIIFGAASLLLLINCPA